MKRIIFSTAMPYIFYPNPPYRNPIVLYDCFTTYFHRIHDQIIWQRLVLHAIKTFFLVQTAFKSPFPISSIYEKSEKPGSSSNSKIHPSEIVHSPSQYKSTTSKNMLVNHSKHHQSISTCTIFTMNSNSNELVGDSQYIYNSIVQFAFHSFHSL